MTKATVVKPTPVPPPAAVEPVREPEVPDAAQELDGPAREMFEAYNAAGPNPGKTWDGKDVPPYWATSNQVRAKWRAAAATVLGPLERMAKELETARAEAQALRASGACKNCGYQG